MPWAECAWCGTWFVNERGSRGVGRGQRHCSKRCGVKNNKRIRKAREYGATGTFTWSEVMRQFVLAEGRCSYCDCIIEGQPDPDHVVPLSRGGTNSITNITVSCRTCNTDKRDLLLSEWQADREKRGKPVLRYVLDHVEPRFRHLVLG